MDSRRKKGNPFSNLFRRSKDSSRRSSKGDKKDEGQTPTVSPAAASSHGTTSGSPAVPQTLADPRQPVAHPDENPLTKQRTEPSVPTWTEPKVQSTPSITRHDASGDPPSPSIASTSLPHPVTRSYSGPAILPHPETYAKSSNNNPPGNSQRQGNASSQGEGLSDQHIKIWDEAYDELKRLEPDLVKTYEKILSQDYELAAAQHDKESSSSSKQDSGENVIEQDDWTKRRWQMDAILKKILLQTTKPAGAEGKVTDAIDVVLSLKEVIGNSLHPVPIAALAWTGVCIGLKLVSDAVAEQRARNNGVADIALKMKWYSSLSQVVLDDKNKKLANLRSALPDGILDFYVNILTCLFKCICAVYNGKVQIFKDMLRLDGWESIFRLTLQKEESFRNAIRDYSDERKISYLELLVDLYRSAAEDEIMRKLFVINMRTEIQSLQHRKDDLIPESSNWILSNDLFLQFTSWKDGNRCRRLWIKGKAGMGKTMLLIGIVRKLEDELASQAETRFDPPYLAYFFCQGTNGRLNTATAVVRGLIWMFLRQEHSLIQHAMGLSGQSLDDDLSTFLDLKNILLAMLRNPIMRRVYIIIDALDECVEASRSDGVPGRGQLLDLVCQLSRDYPNVKCLASSRDELDIEMKFSRAREKSWECLQLELDRKVLAGPIKAYITKKISDLEREYVAEWELDGEVEEEARESIRSKLRAVTKEMHRKADGTFLWVALIFMRIEDERTDLRELPNLVNETPDKLEEIYERMMLQIQTGKDGNSRLCGKALAIATTANRPLRLSELRLLAEFPRDASPLKILKLCRFFRIAEDDDQQKTVYMIHQSAKQWLEQQLRQGLLDAVEGTGSDYLASAHAFLAKRCLQILRGTLRKNIWNLPHSGVETSQIQPRSQGRVSGISQDRIVYSPHPAEGDLTPAAYATLNWFDHVSKAASHDNTAILAAILGFMKHQFLYWLEALSLLHHTGEGTAIISRLVRYAEGLANSGTSSKPATDLISLTRDANRFALYYRGIIENAPLQVYAAGLAFSPAGSQIRRLFERERPAWITTAPIVEEQWSPCLQTLESHKGSVLSVAFSHDGKRLASGSNDKTVRIWAAETGTLQQTLQGHRDWISSVAFSGDGKQLASGSDDKSVRIWDTETGILQQILMEHQDVVSSVAFSPRGDRLASGSHDGKVRIYDPETGVLCRVIQAADVWVLSVAFSNDGARLAAGMHDGKVGIWGVDSGLQHRLHEAHRSSVSSVAFSQDDRRLASGSYDRTVRTWDTATGELLQTLEGHKSPVLSLAFSRQGSRLAFGSRNNLVRIWNSETNVIERSLKGHRNSTLSVTFSPDGKRLASGSQDKTIRIWDAEIEAVEQTSQYHTNSVSSLTFSHDGKLLASGSFDNTIRIWDAGTGVLRKVLEGHRNSVYSLAFTADGKYLASASHDKTVHIWNTDKWSLHHTLKGHRNSVFSVAFSPDGRQISSGSHDKTVRLWTMETGVSRHVLKGHGNAVSSVAFSHDGKLLISGSHDKTVRVWNAETGTLVRTLTCTSSISSIAFSPDGRLIAAGTHDEAVIIWHAETGEVDTPSLKIGSAPSALSFSLDGRGLVTERGYVPLEPPPYNNNDDHSNQLSEGASSSCYSLLADKSWITCKGEKLLWIPWEYRPVCLMVLRDHTVAMGCASGRVLLLKFSETISPV